MNIVTQIEKDLRELSNPARARQNAYFFKTGPGHYGEGDKFIGVSVPDTRTVVRKYFENATLVDVKELLYSPFHEMRLTGVLILVAKYSKAEVKAKTLIYKFYMANAKQVNNWDLVDSSASYIVGEYISLHMEHEERLATINKCIASKNLWVNRIIVLASFYQIKLGNPKMAFYIIPKFMDHKPRPNVPFGTGRHDLLNKACGWMLREIGKACGEKTLRLFLDKYYKTMPRTMLRYAVERLDTKTKEKYMKK